MVLDIQRKMTVVAFHNIGCFQRAFTDVNLKSGIFLRILSFSESRKYDLLEQLVSFNRSNLTFS